MPKTASPEIYERFKVGCEWWNNRELDLMQEWYAEDAVFDVSAVFTDIRPFHGHENMRRYWDDQWETWEGMRMDPLEVFELADGRFVVEIRLWGKGKRSGAEVDQRFAFLYTVRANDETILRSQLFPDVQAAMDFATASATQSG